MGGMLVQDPRQTATRTAGDAAPAALPAQASAAKIDVTGLNFYYGTHKVLEDIHLKIQPNQVTALIGPSGCGKSTFLRSLNRMNDIMPGTRVEGSICIDGEDIYALVGRRRRPAAAGRDGLPEVEPVSRSRFSRTSPTACASTGMTRSREELRGRVEASLKSAALWDEVHDRLHTSALALSGGQQQRLCIARALAVEPEILLMDEPASALDPIATQRIEELIYQLKARYTIVIVTHNMQQAARVSDVTAFFWLGKLIECDRTEQDLHRAVREADRGLRHRKVRLMETTERVVRHFQEELEQLKTRLLEMGGLAEEEVRLAVKGLVERDLALIDQALVGDEPLNTLHIEIDSRCFTLLALYQPMAADLRTIVAAVKINTDLERVGDLAVNIAEAAQRYIDARRRSRS